MQSYFGVGSIRNVLMTTSLSHGATVLAALYGLSWLALMAGGVLLLLRQPLGRGIARTAAAAAAIVFTAGTILLSAYGDDATSRIFTVSRPLYDIFLFAMLPVLSQERGSPAPVSRYVRIALMSAGALIPWLAYPAARLVHGGPLLLPRSPGLFVAAFMTLWSILPFFTLVLTADAWPAADRRNAVLAAGGIGTAAAGFYAYGLIWSQGLNVFLLALLPPVVFAGQASGIIAWSLLASRLHESA